MYYVDRNLYEKTEQNHPTAIATTEYSFGRFTLTHLQIGANHGVRLNNILSYKFNTGVAFEQFFIKKTRKHGEPKSIDRDTFESELKSFNKSRTSLEREIVKQYDYINQNGNPDSVQIVIKMRSGSMTAMIMFATVEQWGNAMGRERRGQGQENGVGLGGRQAQ